MDLLFVIAAVLVFWLATRKSSAPGDGTGAPASYGNKASGLDNLAQGIASNEGFFLQNSLAARTNNPGNVGTYNGKVNAFADVGDGWDRLYSYLRGLIGANPQWDLYDLSRYYLTGSTTGVAGPKQMNPDSYAENIANYAGVDPTAPVSTWAG